MIASKDLRIGNLVNEAILGICPVVQIEKNTVWLGANHLTFDNTIQNQMWHLTEDGIEPIPLTKEILEKCGFEKHRKYIGGTGSYDVYINGKIQFLQPSPNGHLQLPFYESKIDSLHELQNLYKALTNEELTINL
jgi:hypothetical protein